MMQQEMGTVKKAAGDVLKELGYYWSSGSMEAVLMPLALKHVW